MLSLATKENAYIFGFIGLVFIVEVVLWERLSLRNQLWLYLGGLVLSGLLLAAGVLLGTPAGRSRRGPKPSKRSAAAVKLVMAILIVVGGTIPLMPCSAPA